MKKRDVGQWARRQYRADVQPWPMWLRLALAIGAVLLALKLRGVL